MRNALLIIIFLRIFSEYAPDYRSAHYYYTKKRSAEKVRRAFFYEK